MILAGHLCRLLLGAVLMAAGLLKALDPEALIRETAQYGLLPEPLVAPFATALIPAEIVVGTALLLDWRRVLSMGAATALMAIFIVTIAFALITDKPLESCGCFGSRVPRTPQQTLVEDLALAGAGLFGIAAFTGRRRAPARREFPGGGRWKGATLATVAVASTAFTVASPRLPIDDFATALAPGVIWSDLEVALAERDLSQGRHLVAILGLTDEPSAASIAPLNALASEPEWETSGLYAGEEGSLVEFTFSRGPAFPLYQVSPSDLGRLHRRFPRVFAVDGGRVAATWSRVPEAPEVRQAFGAAPAGPRSATR